MPIQDPGKPRETGKRRAYRIPLDYFRTRSPLDVWKSRLSLWALVLSLLGASGLVYGVVSGPDAGQLPYSRGHVTAVHATWNAKCSACHESFSPISEDAVWTEFILGSSHATDTKCNTCHRGDGAAAHHASQKPEDVQSCASCHQDHRGADASLLRMADTHCTSCHADLAEHRLAEVDSPLQYENVTQFGSEPKQHPEFRLIRDKQKDPGHLKFNHALHLRAGMARTPEKPADPYRLSDIQDDEARRRYGWNGTNGDEPVQLDCASCHLKDAVDFGLKPGEMGASWVRDRVQGAYMQPILYEIQCAACHRLGFDPEYRDMVVPHGLQPTEVRSFVWGEYARRIGTDADADVAPAGSGSLRAGFPGKDLTITQKQEVDAKADDAENFLFRKQLDEADRLIFAGKRICGECHHYVDEQHVEVPLTTPPAGIVQPDVPQVWYTHAKFDHNAHRAVNCNECHERAYPQALNPSEKSDDVLIPGIVTCVKCHAPAGHKGAEAVGGARFDCAECHRYHNGDHAGPLQGVGAIARDASLKRELLDFLSGSGKGSTATPGSTTDGR